MVLHAISRRRRSSRPLTSTNDAPRGQILVLFTLVLIALLSFAALVVDLGMLRNDRQTLTNTMDAAALAGGTLMPVDGSLAGAFTKVNDLVVMTINANFKGLSSSRYTITYKCLIGVDSSVPAKALHLAGHPARVRSQQVARSSTARQRLPRRRADPLLVVRSVGRRQMQRHRGPRQHADGLHLCTRRSASTRVTPASSARPPATARAANRRSRPSTSS